MRERKEALMRGPNAGSRLSCRRRMAQRHRSAKIQPMVMRNTRRQVRSWHPTAPVVHHFARFFLRRSVPTAAAGLG